MKIDRRIVAGLMGALLAGLITACAPWTVSTTNCSNGGCVTTHATLGPDKHRQPPATTRAPQPVITVTTTATATITPSDQP